MRQRKIWLAPYLICLLSSCAHGPDVTACSNDPSLSQFECSNKAGDKSVVPYVDAVSYSAYPSDSVHALLDYCAARSQPETQPPVWMKCSIDLASEGFDCFSQVCQISSEGGGLTCKKGVASFVRYADSTNFAAFSQPDTQTLLDYCNVSLN